MLGKCLQLKDLLSPEKLVNNRISMNCRWTADLFTGLSDRIARAFNSSGATWAVALDIPKAFGRVWHASFLHKLKCCGISGQILGIISSFLSNRWLSKVLDGNSSPEYPAGNSQGSILGPTLFCYTLMVVLMMLSVILLFMLMILLFKCDQAFDLWQPLELACEL